MALECMNRLACIDVSKTKLSITNRAQFRFMTYLRETQKINKIHWAKLRAKKWPTDHALSHFDYFYGTAFGRRWPSIRIALLSPNKYCAVVNTFISSDVTSKKLEDLAAINLRTYYETRLSLLTKQTTTESSSVSGQNSSEFQTHSAREVSTETSVNVEEDFDENSQAVTEVSTGIEKYETSYPEEEGIDYVNVTMNDFVPVTKYKYDEKIITDQEYYSFYKPESEVNITFEEEPVLSFPPYLDVYTFPRGDVSDFPAPSKDNENLLDYYLMDGGSILPGLVLGVNSGDVVGDLCAAPGGKSLSVLFTMLPSKLVCADKSATRIKKMNGVFASYVPPTKSAEIIKVVQMDVCNWPAEEIFDKILLDVPCTNDRLSLRENDNNIFHEAKIKQRTMVPQVQKMLLSHALKLLKPGGSLVYSTCSLSPIQNDGVVHMALKEVWEHTKLELVVNNLYRSLAPFRGLYAIRSCRYGQLVIPFLPCNYGPMYVSKITRKK